MEWFDIIKAMDSDPLDRVSYINPLIHNFTQIAIKCAESGMHDWYYDFILNHTFHDGGNLFEDEVFEFNGLVEKSDGKNCASLIMKNYGAPFLLEGFLSSKQLCPVRAEQKFNTA